MEKKMKNLYSSKQGLIVDNSNYCYVYTNGWYKLKKNDKFSLYNFKQELIADDLDYCEVY